MAGVVAGGTAHLRSLDISGRIPGFTVAEVIRGENGALGFETAALLP
jgi:hypothetical protein